MFNDEHETIQIPGPRFKSPIHQTADREKHAARQIWEAYGIPEEYQHFRDKKYQEPETFLEHKITSIFRRGELLSFENDDEETSFFREFSSDLKKRPPKKIIINAAPIWEGLGDKLLAHIQCNVIAFDTGYSREFKNVGVEDLVAYKPYAVSKDATYLSWGPVRHFFTSKEWLRACKFMTYARGYHRILTASIATDPDDPYAWVLKQMGVDPATFDYIFELAVEPAKFAGGSQRKAKSSEGRVEVEL